MFQFQRRCDLLARDPCVRPTREILGCLTDRFRARREVFVDLYQALVGNVTLYIGTDGLHPTEIGYQKIAETFFNSIQATLQTP